MRMLPWSLNSQTPNFFGGRRAQEPHPSEAPVAFISGQPAAWLHSSPTLLPPFPRHSNCSQVWRASLEPDVNKYLLQLLSFLDFLSTFQSVV